MESPVGADDADDAVRAAAPLLPSSLSTARAATATATERFATSTQGAAQSAARYGRQALRLDTDGATSEVYLGVGATLLGTLAIWMVCMPVFDIGGTALIKHFEGNSSSAHRELVRLGDYKERVLTQYDTPDDAFKAMDDSSVGVIDLAEFIRAAKKYDPPLSDRQAEELFRGLDVDGDKLLSSPEFFSGMDARGAALAASAAAPPPRPHKAAQPQPPPPRPHTAAPPGPAPAPQPRPRPGQGALGGPAPAEPAAQKPAAPAQGSLPVPLYTAESSLVASPAKKGATKVSVADKGLFHVGDRVRLVGGGGRTDTVRVTALGPPVAFAPPLKHGYETGCEIRLEEKANASGTKHDGPQPSHRKEPAPTGAPASNATSQREPPWLRKRPPPGSETDPAGNGSAALDHTLADDATADAKVAPARRATAPPRDAPAGASAPNGSSAGANASGVPLALIRSNFSSASASKGSTAKAKASDAPAAASASNGSTAKAKASDAPAAASAPNGSSARAKASDAPVVASASNGSSAGANASGVPAGASASNGSSARAIIASDAPAGASAPNGSTARANTSDVLAVASAPNGSSAGANASDVPARASASNGSSAGANAADVLADASAPAGSNASGAGTTEAPQGAPAHAGTPQVVAYRPGTHTGDAGARRPAYHNLANGSTAGASAQGEATVAPGHRWAALTAELTVEQLQRSMGPFAPGKAFDVLDADHDGRTSLDDWLRGGKAFEPPLAGQRAEAAFRGLDADGDGMVTKEEFLNTLKAGKFAAQRDAAPRRTQKPSGDRLDVAGLLHRVAAGRDAAVAAPWAAGASAPGSAAAGPARSLDSRGLQDAFAILDKDHDGVLLLDNLASNKEDISPPLTLVEAECTFQDMDTDRDGKVSLAEFLFASQADRRHFHGACGGQPRPGADSIDQVLDTAAQSAYSDGRFLANGGASTTQPAASTTQPAAAATQPAASATQPAVSTTQPAVSDGAVSMTPAPSGGPQFTLSAFEECMRGTYSSADAAFMALDSNGDGVCDFEEFVLGVARFQPPLTAPQAAYAFKGLDADQDGTVTRDEFLTIRDVAHAAELGSAAAAAPAAVVPFWAPGFGVGPPARAAVDGLNLKEFRSRMPSTSLEDAFEALDGSDDGFIDANEFAMSTKAFVPPLDTAEAVSVFAGLDMDHDDKVTQAEFMEALGPPHQKVAKSDEAEPASTAAATETATAAPSEPRISSSSVGATRAQHLAGVDLRKRMGAISLKDAMEMLDGDQAGSVSKTEWVDGRKAFVPALAVDEAKAYFTAMDTDRDGELSYEELSDAIPAQVDATPKAPPKGGAASGDGEKSTATTSAAPPPGGGGGTAEAEGQAELAPSMANDLLTVAEDAVQGDVPSTAATTASPTTTTKKTTETTTTVTETETTSLATTTYTFPFPSTRTQTVTASESGASTTAGAAARSHGKSLRGSVKADATTTSKPYDCAAGFNNWKAGWSDGKKRWCCDHEQVGCEGGTISIDQLMERMRTSIGSPPEAMRLLDEDGSGDISQEEFVGATAALKKPLNREEAEFAFQGLDADGDYKVTSSEFFGALKAGHYFHEGPEQSASWTTSTTVTSAATPLSFADFESRLAGFGSPKNAFFEMDDDDDGFISQKELVSHASSFGPPLSERQALDAFRGMDAVTGDGGVSSDEFFGALEAGEFSTASKPASKPRPKKEKQEKKAKTVKATTTTTGAPDGPAAAGGVTVATGRWFRVQLEQWAGSLEAACGKMDLEQDGMISADEFQEGVSSLKPPVSAKDAKAVFAKLDLDGDGRLALEECNPGDASFEAALAPIGDIQNVYKSMDADSDGKLSKKEFVALGPVLDPPMSKGSMLPLFSEADADGDGFVSPEELPGGAAPDHQGEAGGAGDNGQRLAARELAAYRNVSAIASGTAELVLTLRPDSEVPRPSVLSKVVGKVFQAELGKQLGLDVNLASAESVGDGGTVRSVLLMWTSDVEDGGAVQAKLQSRSTSIEKAVEDRVAGLDAPWMSGGTVELWLGCSLDFYGPGAGSLPRGSKLVRTLGRQEDRQAAHSLDSHAGAGTELLS